MRLSVYFNFLNNMSVQDPSLRAVQVSRCVSVPFVSLLPHSWGPDQGNNSDYRPHQTPCTPREIDSLNLHRPSCTFLLDYFTPSVVLRTVNFCVQPLPMGLYPLCRHYQVSFLPSTTVSPSVAPLFIVEV